MGMLFTQQAVHFHDRSCLFVRLGNSKRADAKCIAGGTSCSKRFECRMKQDPHFRGIQIRPVVQDQLSGSLGMYNQAIEGNVIQNWPQTRNASVEKVGVPASTDRLPIHAVDLLARMQANNMLQTVSLRDRKS